MLNSCSESTKLAACMLSSANSIPSSALLILRSRSLQLRCLFSRLWWTVAWTLRCTMPSAVKHNATRLHHSHVWGYRWPAVCLCSSPLGQLEPSISAPLTTTTPTPPEPRCVRLHRPPQKQPETVSSGLSLLQGTLLSFDQRQHCFQSFLFFFIRLSGHDF